MGIFKKSPKQVNEDAATIAVNCETTKELKPPTLAQWKKARKKEKKANAETFASKKTKRSSRINELVSHSTANRSGGPQNEYCYSPNTEASAKQSLNKAADVGADVGWIAMKGFFFGKKKK